MKSTVIVEVSVVPIGTAHASLSRYVADCLSVLNKTGGIKYKLTPMGTIIEGELDAVLQVVRKMHEEPFKKGILRVVTTIKIDDRRDKKASMQKKIESVLKHNPDIRTVKIRYD
ncbi:MAG TPA: MTH1187 family thiamine-binding protein [Dehalococcoidia bacterium]|nr:MTH1187 family thiamine-binding protein [Dehalococcoidia bacterium]